MESSALNVITPKLESPQIPFCLLRLLLRPNLHPNEPLDTGHAAKPLGASYERFASAVMINGWTKVCPVVWLYLALEAQIPDKLLSTH